MKEEFNKLCRRGHVTSQFLMFISPVRVYDRDSDDQNQSLAVVGVKNY